MNRKKLAIKATIIMMMIMAMTMIMMMMVMTKIIMMIMIIMIMIKIMTMIMIMIKIIIMITMVWGILLVGPSVQRWSKDLASTISLSVRPTSGTSMPVSK